MGFPMARTAKGNENLSHIPSQLAARSHMMNPKFLGTSASLASPTIALEHLLAEPPIGIPAQPESPSSWDAKIHDAFGMRSRNSCRWWLGSIK
jgi:hypothetical protein